jgi:hypothetical protein
LTCVDQKGTGNQVHHGGDDKNPELVMDF